MDIHLKIIGIIMVVLGIIHVIFPRYFNWKEDLKSISLINQQLMYVHTFFIGFLVFLLGLLSLFSTQADFNTPIGSKIALGVSIFWGVRLFFQFFVYSSKLWKGKLFETIVHVLFSCLWVYFTVVFFLLFYSF
ncbi:hypothetical protein AD998_02495 [bacterium 336/3]|nr:hypothetical protein AD998_02495 [bacterium 336/3]